MKNTNRQNIKFPQDKDLGRQISEEFYKTTFIRDPLDRLFSAYRDKFTGTLDHSSGKHDQCFYNFLNRTSQWKAKIEFFLFLTEERVIYQYSVHSTKWFLLDQKYCS